MALKKKKTSKRKSFEPLSDANLWMGTGVFFLILGLMSLYKSHPVPGFTLLFISIAILMAAYFNVPDRFRGSKDLAFGISKKSSKQGAPAFFSASWFKINGVEFLSGSLVLVALVLGVVAQGRVVNSPEMPSWKLWVFYGFCGVLFAVGVFLPAWVGRFKSKKVKGSQQVQSLEPSLSPKFEWSIFAGIMVLAAFLRIYRLENMPSGIFIDQGMEGWSALRILHERFTPVWEFDVWQNPGLLLYQLADWLLLISPFHKEPSQFTFYLFYALFSLATFPLVYWTFRQLGGQRLALLGTYVLAVMYWNINFSRNGFPTIEVPFYTFGTLAFLLYALKPDKNSDFFRKVSLVVAFLFLVGVLPFMWFAYGSVLLPFRVGSLLGIAVLLAIPAWLVWEYRRLKDKVPFLSFLISGIFLGTGMYTYQTFKIVPLLLILIGFYELIQDHKRIFSLGKPILAFLAVALFLTFPFIRHTLTQGAVDQRMGELIVHNWATFLANSARTLNMFNWHGDNMARHNLQDHRELDDVTGVLFIFGVVSSIFFIRRRPWFYGLMGMILLSVPCLLSIDAAHANRMLGVTPFIALLAALPLTALWSKVRRWTGPSADWIFPVLLIAPLYSMLAQNYDTYFNGMAKSNTTWREYAVEETAVAKLIPENGDAYDYYLSPRFYNYYTITFMGYFHPNRVHPLVLPDALISHDSSGTRGMIFALEEGRTGLLDLLKFYYPNGQADYLIDPSGNKVEYFYKVPGSEIAKVRGLKGHFEFQGAPAENRTLNQFPLGLPAGPYRAHLSGNLYIAEAGKYKFELQGIAGAILKTQARPDAKGFRFLEKGYHPIEIDLKVPAGPAPGLIIQQVGEKGLPQKLDAGSFDILSAPRGLIGSYHRDPMMKDVPFLTQVDPVLNFTNGNDFSAAPPFYTRWTGVVEAAEDGEYQFILKTMDQIELKIDGKQWIERGTVRGKSGFLKKGKHGLEILLYKPSSNWSALSFEWIPPGGKLEVVPTSALDIVP
jgi:hypothetical protein